VKTILEASQAVAEAVKACNVEVVSIYPITPQTHIVEEIAKFVDNGEMNAEVVYAESEHSMFSAAAGASAAGARSFTASSSQGLALGFEILGMISGMRLPVVAAVANRALSSPINIWNDHSDTMSIKDTGWIQLYVESAQEAFDTTVQAFRIAEECLIPVMVCLDGFTLSHVTEPLELENVSSFVGKYKGKYILDPEKPLLMGPVATPDSYMEIKELQQKDTLDSKKIVKKIHDEYKKKYKRGYGDGLIETYNLKGKKKALILMGSAVGTARVVSDEEKDFGVIKLKCFRPFPNEELKKVCKDVKEIAVIDRSLSFGQDSAVYTEVKKCLPNKKISGFVAGLGGRDITRKTIKDAVKQIGKEGQIWLK